MCHLCEIGFVNKWKCLNSRSHLFTLVLTHYVHFTCNIIVTSLYVMYIYMKDFKTVYKMNGGKYLHRFIK